MRIAIVDDDGEFRETTEEIVRKFCRAAGEEADILCVAEGNTLLETAESKRSCDIYILDVELPGLDGLELAGRLRERDGDAGIVILSNYEKYALPAYKVRPYDYIMKTRCEAELPGALEGIWRERQRKARENIYLLKNNEMMKAIRLDRILYLEKEKKKKYTVIHCSGGEDYNEKLPLEKAYEKLPKDSFLYINRGHIINMEHITCLEKEEITLADSVRLPVSRYRMTAVKDELDTVFQDLIMGKLLNRENLSNYLKWVESIPNCITCKHNIIQQIHK